MVEKTLSPLEEIFFELIRAGLHGRRPDIPKDLSLQDWAGLLKLAKMQSVTGLLYRGVSFCGEGYPLPEPVLFRLVAEDDRVERTGARLRQASEDLTLKLSSAGLHPILLKGATIAAYYPVPLQREYGDIDLYLPPEEFDKAPEMLGVPVTTAPDGSIHYSWQEMDVDQHRRYFDLHIPEQKLPAPGTPEATLLMLSAHAMKHAVGTGVGLRQCIDMAMAYEHLGPELSPERLESVFRASGTYKWNRLLSAFIEEYLDFHPLFGGAGTRPEPLLKIVQQGGNFGHHAHGRLEAIGKSALRRKADTTLRFLRRLPFSLKYAAGETLRSVFSLAAGNQ
jgi:hypothetical protein